METILEIIRTLIAPAMQVLFALTAAYLVALWVTLIIWTYRDIEARSRSVITQVFATLLAVFFFVPGVLLYFILRPKETLDDAFQRALQEEYMIQDLEELPLCPTCRRYVQSDFVLCPHCQTRLREHCPNCERLVELRWNVCPYCTAALPGADEGEVVAEGEAAPPLSLPDWMSPAVHRLRARMASLRAQHPVEWVAGSNTTRADSTGLGETDGKETPLVGLGTATPERADRDTRPRSPRQSPVLVGKEAAPDPGVTKPTATISKEDAVAASKAKR